MLKRTSLIIAVLAITFAFPLSVGAASKSHTEGTWRLADGITVTLTKLGASPDGRVVATSQGYWNAGCYYAVTNAFGQVIYSYTIWQQFGSNYSYINYLPAPSYSSQTDTSWSLTSHSESNWWINGTHQDAAAQGNWTFTQYVNGQPYRNASGWVQVQVHASGTWNCYSS